MNDGIAAAAVIGIIFFGLVSIIRAITDYQLRRKLIQQGHVDPRSASVLQPPQDNRLTALKWGLIVLFGGIGLIVISLVGMDDDTPLPYGIEAVSIAIGFLAYYFVSRSDAVLPPTRSNVGRETSSSDYINS